MADISSFTDGEIEYFPHHSRASGVASNPILEASIDAKFSSIEVAERSAVAIALRTEGIRRHLESIGVKATDESISNFIASVDNQAVTEAVIMTRPSYDAPLPTDHLLPGLFIFYGSATAGKSAALAHIHEKMVSNGIDSVYLIAGEPDHRAIQGWDILRTVILSGFAGNDEPEVLCIDSLKDALYATGKGGLTTGGVSTQFMIELSSLSATLMAKGRTVIAVVNPSQNKLEGDLYETIKSNVTGIFKLHNSGVIDGSLRRWHTDGYYERVEKPSLDDLFINKSPANQTVTSLLQGSSRDPRVINAKLARLIHNTTPRNNVK